MRGPNSKAEPFRYRKQGGSNMSKHIEGRLAAVDLDTALLGPSCPTAPQSKPFRGLGDVRVIRAP